jgi:hypothetical protein
VVVKVNLQEVTQDQEIVFQQKDLKQEIKRKRLTALLFQNEKNK